LLVFGEGSEGDEVEAEEGKGGVQGLKEGRKGGREGGRESV
jgi:hypothetical protein